MTRLVHLTDLHFGLHRETLVEPLRAAVLANDPDLVVVSGDLTQRARASQFTAAMSFLARLGRPFLSVPGNHDIPLFNPVTRLFSPFGPFRRHVGEDLAPVLQIGDLRLFGANTADPWRWRRGVARHAEIDRVCNLLREGERGGLNILVAHHPFEEPIGFERGETRGATAALAKLAEAGLHMVLSGHLHNWSVGLGITPARPRPIFQMQTGTALCDRPIERDHGFTVLDFDKSSFTMAVTPWVVDEAKLEYLAQKTSETMFRDRMWHAQ
jgi:3',5'-cyclic AMP phosphodiesterase CpdA